MSEIINFDCVAEKNLFFKESYKIYSVKVDKEKYPDIVLDPIYHTAKIVGGNIYELDIGKTYHVSATPQSSPKYGISYEVISITGDEPKTESDIRSFLMTVLTYNQAQQIIQHYPNIIDLIKEGRDSEIDLNKLKGIGEKTFESIKKKILNNFKLIDMCSIFYNMITLNMMKKLYEEFGSAEKVKEALYDKPYSSLYKIDRVGFKKSDEILLKIEEEINNQIENGEEPKFKFRVPLKDSPDRCLACMEYYLEMNEQDGNTKMKVEDLKAKVSAYVKEASVFFNAMIEEECFYYDKTEQTIGLIETYNLEKYIAKRIVEANKNPILWNFDLSKYTKLDEFNLTEEQQNAQKFLCKNNVVILNGAAGCVDCDTEFFNGEEWKRIADWTLEDKVLQYNQNGTAELVKPQRYIKIPCDQLWHFETKYGLNQTICDDHNIIYWSKKGYQHNCKIKDIIYDQQHNNYGWQGYFKTVFNYGGKGINLTDNEIRIMCAVICDGSFYYQAESHWNSYNTCRFHIKKDRKKDRLRHLFKEANLEYREVESANKGYTDFYIEAPLRQKVFDKSWYECSNHQLQIICDEILNWDGHYGKTEKGFIRKSFSTTVKETADFIQFAFSACGYRASICISDRVGQNYKTNDKIYNRKSIEYDISITNRTYIGIVGEKGRNHKQTEIIKVPTTDGFKYCFTVPSHMLILRRKNCIFVTGNCGKTSSVRSLTNMLIDHHLTFNMAAPSAKAAKVLTRYAGYEATTIHRMLGYNNGNFTFDEKNPITSDVVIIDETSMLDVWLMVSLLKAIDFGKTKLLLVGDSYQLPSVGAGNLFYDLIESKICPISTLTQIFRYSEGGLIKVATDIRNSKQYLPNKLDPKKPIIPFGNSYFFCSQAKERCVDYVIKMYCKLAETHSLEDIMVITAQNKGEYGTVILNNKIQDAINPNKETVIKHTNADGIEIEYRLNDIVMQTTNDYHSIICDEYGYYEREEDGKPMYETLIANGENGRITHIGSGGMVVKYDNYYIWRTKADLEKISLGYAITCHKSQGSGCNNVIILTPSAHTWMVNSNLLYVSCTRAKSKCYHIGNLQTVNSAIKKKANLKRSTFLQGLLKKEMERLNG